MRCHHPDCGFQTVAPSHEAAVRQMAEHIVDEHSTEVDVDVPDGKAYVSHDGGETWEEVDHDDAF